MSVLDLEKRGSSIDEKDMKRNKKVNNTNEKLGDMNEKAKKEPAISTSYSHSYI